MYVCIYYANSIIIIVANCFRKAGFRQPTPAQENRDEHGDDAFATLRELLGSLDGVTVEEYIDVDKSVLTEAVLSDEEIIQNVLNPDKDEEVNDDGKELEKAPVTVDYAAAYRAFTTLSQWFNVHSLPLQSLHDVENSMFEFRFQNSRQMHIDEFFPHQLQRLQT